MANTGMIIFPLIILLLCGFILPYIHQGLDDNNSVIDYNVGNFGDKLSADAANPITGWTILFSILGVLTWSFTENIWLNFIFLILKIILIIGVLK